MCASPRADASDRLGLRWPGLLLVLWFAPGLVASALLLRLFKGEPWGTVLHVVVLAALLLLLLLPSLPELLRGRWPRWQQRSTAAALATAQGGLLLFYGLAFVGHRYWGNWINLDLALAYAPQLPGLFAAMERSLPAAVLGLLLAWAALFATHAGLLSRLAAARGRDARRPSTALGVGLLLGSLVALALLYRSWVRDTDFWFEEPLRQAGLSAGFGAAGDQLLIDPVWLRREQAVAAAYHPPPPPRPRPLVLIIVDALRDDVLGVSGSGVPNTPFLSSLAASGRLRRVDPAWSVCTVSYCGILGTLSSRHWAHMPPQPFNLADALHRLGYETHFVLGGDHTSYFGLRTMFGPSVDVMHDGSDQHSRYSNDDRLVLDALDATGWPRDRPGFLYVHLMSAHRLGLIQDAYKRWDAGDAPAYSRYATLDARRDGASRARYHNGVLQADAMIRAIFERLAAWRVLDDALVVITADHGDFLGEHGQWSHGQPPMEPVSRIPLLVVDRAGAAAWPARALAAQTDIAPTLLHAIGAPVPPHWAGTPLQLASARHELLVESAEASGVVALVDGQRWKYLRLRDTGAESLFHLRPDGEGEGRNLAVEPNQRAVLVRLREAHARVLAGPPAASTGLAGQGSPGSATPGR